MKIGICSIFINSTCNKNKANGLEIYYMRKALIESGHDVYVIGYKNINNKHQDFYINAEDAPWETFDAIVLQNSKPVFFGGEFRTHIVPIIEGIAKSRVQLYNFIADPHLPPTNPAKAMGRFNLCQEYVEIWDQLINESIQIFPGKDIKKFNGWEKGRLIYFDMFTYMFKNHFKNKDNDVLFDIEHPKKYDVIYFGRNRKAYREKVLKRLMPESINNIIVGYKSKNINVNQIPQIKHEELLNMINQSKVSLIIGDEEHLDNVITFRFYETLASDCLAAIQIEYDSDKKLIKDPVLRDILYVKNSEDVKRLVDMYSPDLILRQKNELKRIFDEFNQVLDLNNNLIKNV